MTEAILAKDRRYPGDFEHLPFKGYAEQHSLTLDLGTLAEDQHYVLLLYGWVDYADSSSNLAAGQAGVRAVTPYLEVGDKDGNFRMGLEQMGFPAGLPKTMLVDLEGLVGPNTNRVRITTNMRLHWDEIRLAVVEPSAKLTKVELPASGARLAFRGYPRSMTPDGKAPNVYDYAQIDTTALWGTHEGFYTRYGDVRELVESVDDRYVITHHGDELTLRFDAAKLPPLPDGYRRSFMAVADGFGKDMDLNAARPHSVEPLPFHSMESYPYVEPGYPTDEIRTRYRNEYNTRYIGPQYRNPFTTLDYLAKQNGARTRSVR